MWYSKILLIMFLQIAVVSLVSSKVVAGEINVQKLYEKHCVICHGEDGKGKTDLGEGLGARDYTENKFQESITDEKMVEQITNGSEGKMFPFKDKLTMDEMKALVHVIRAFGE